jgi:hypothetical protein
MEAEPSPNHINHFDLLDGGYSIKTLEANEVARYKSTTA